jgi:hypothetical protein
MRAQRGSSVTDGALDLTVVVGIVSIMVTFRSEYRAMRPMVNGNVPHGHPIPARDPSHSNADASITRT